MRLKNIRYNFPPNNISTYTNMNIITQTRFSHCTWITNSFKIVGVYTRFKILSGIWRRYTIYNGIWKPFLIHFQLKYKFTQLTVYI